MTEKIKDLEKTRSTSPDSIGNPFEPGFGGKD
jgi:hypothetical protein